MTDQTTVVKDALMDLVVTQLGAGSSLRLYKSTFTPTPDSVIADFEANKVVFTGYAPVTLVGGFQAGYDGGANMKITSLTMGNFTQTAVTDNDTAAGWYLSDGFGTVLLGHGALDTPFAFNKVGNTLQLVPEFDPLYQSDQVANTQVGP